MKTLIVPTDFSPSSLNAMNYAIDMAKAIDAKILLMNVYQIPVAYTELPMTQVETSYQELKKASEDKLEELKKEIQRLSAGSLEVYTESRLGDTVDEIESLCKSVKPFAVVMGSHGLSGLERLIMGSTTLSAIRHIKYPVIAVPPGTTYKGISKIGLACDFKDVTTSIPTGLIKDMVTDFGAELHVLNVGDPEKQHDGKIVLESAHLDAMLENIKPQYHFLNNASVIDGINAFVETNSLDLVIIIPKKHRLPDSLFHKSNSKELVTHAHVPIVSIHE